MTLRPEAVAVERRAVAPAWFDAALGQAPERTCVHVEGVEIEVLAWGERGLPGLLLLHGFTAHADWWSFLAPLLAQSTANHAKTFAKFYSILTQEQKDKIGDRFNGMMFGMQGGGPRGQGGQWRSRRQAN